MYGEYLKTNGRPMKSNAARPMNSWTMAKMLLYQESLSILKLLSGKEREPVPEMRANKKKE